MEVRHERQRAERLVAYFPSAPDMEAVCTTPPPWTDRLVRRCFEANTLRDCRTCHTQYSQEQVRQSRPDSGTIKTVKTKFWRT